MDGFSYSIRNVRNIEMAKIQNFTNLTFECGHGTFDPLKKMFIRYFNTT